MEKNLNYEKYRHKILNKIEKLQKEIQTLAKTVTAQQNVRILLIISISIIYYHLQNHLILK